MTKKHQDWQMATHMLHAHRSPPRQQGALNPPIQRASTIIFERADDLYRDDIRTYGLEGMDAHDELAATLASLCGGTHAVLAPSGLSALTLAMLTLLDAGDHVLITDNAYGPTRRFADQFLARMGISASYFAPDIGADIGGAILPNTKLVILESPGSLTFEVSDIPAIASVCRARGVTTMIDDTWSAGLYFKPLALSVDISMQALTKYPAGHGDVLAGALIVGDEALFARLRDCHKQLGLGVSAEDVALTLRGLRTMALRMAAQDKSARALATFLRDRPEVSQLLHPAIEGCPGHDIFTRDFTGAGGLFGFRLQPDYRHGVHDFLESLRLFAMGFSWGGYESLILPCDPQIRRTAKPWDKSLGPLIRISAGLEDVDDLIADLEAGLNRLSGQV